MKKVIIALLMVLFCTGCVSIKNDSLDNIVDSCINNKYDLHNHLNRGYKYYLPRELKATTINEYNDLIQSKYYDYYLYVDLVSYYNKVNINYKQVDNIFYSKLLGDVGIINIKETQDDKFIVEAYYNYAKMEVKVKKEDINIVVNNVLSVLSTIKYNDDVIMKILENNVLSTAEEPVNIFKIKSDKSDFLEVDEEDMYTGNEDEDYDPDVINQRR